MPFLKEFVPDCLKQYIRLVAAKLRYRSSFIGSPFVGKRVTLGKGCSISRGVEIGCDVRIGDFSYLNCGAVVASGRIGKFCSVGPYALIGLADHPIDYLSTSPLLYGASNVLRGTASWTDFPSPPEIGNDVWIGAQAFVRQGVRIGDGAYIGAGSIITENVPADALALARGRQVNKLGWAAARRRELAAAAKPSKSRSRKKLKHPTKKRKVSRKRKN